MRITADFQRSERRRGRIDPCESFFAAPNRANRLHRIDLGSGCISLPDSAAATVTLPPGPVYILIDQALLNSSISDDTSIAQERPVRSMLAAASPFDFRHNNFFAIDAALRHDLAAGCDD